MTTPWDRSQRDWGYSWAIAPTSRPSTAPQVRNPGAASLGWVRVLDVGRLLLAGHLFAVRGLCRGRKYLLRSIPPTFRLNKAQKRAKVASMPQALLGYPDVPSKLKAVVGGTSPARESAFA